MSGAIAIDTIEIAHLELVYAHTRILRQRQMVHLADSLLRIGQLLPIVVVKGVHPRFVLIDGYCCVSAARRAGLDTLQAQIWPDRAEDALCQLLARDGARQFDVFEQAALLRELKIAHRLSQRQIAAKMGRHPSWVTRRLALIEELPQSAQDAVRAGHLSCWSASRVLTPLARANHDHAEALVDAVCNHSVTSRQLLCFWQHYRAANRGLRKKMIDEPVLFFKSLAAKEADKSAKLLKEGPEGRWRRNMNAVKHLLLRLEQSAAQVFYPGQQRLQRRRLTTTLNDARANFDLLEQTVRSLVHAKPSRQTNRDCDERSRPKHPADRPHLEDVPKDDPAHPGRQCSGSHTAANPL